MLRVSTTRTWPTATTSGDGQTGGEPVDAARVEVVRDLRGEEERAARR